MSSSIADRHRTKCGLWLLTLVLLLGFSACQLKDQVATLSPERGRRIELLIRSQYDIPADYQLALGRKSRSRLPGYYDLPVTFAHAGKEVKFTFMLSQDEKRLARLQEYDLTQEPFNTAAFTVGKRLGDPNAKVTILIFDDLACPYCARLYAELFPDMLNRYKSNVKIVYKEYPLRQAHPWALHAAINADCLAQQNTDAYWSYVGNIHLEHAAFSNDKQHLSGSLQQLDNIAMQEAGVDPEGLRRCINRQDDSSIRASIAEGDKIGVESAPTVFVNGERIVGARPIDWFYAAVDRALKSEGIVLPQTEVVQTSLATK